MQDTAPNVSLLALFVVWLGPLIGPYALVVFAAIAGAGLALTTEKPMTRLEGLWYVLLSTMVAMLLAGPLAWAVEKYTAVPANVALIPVALVLGAVRTKLLPIFHTALDALTAAGQRRLASRGEPTGSGQ